MPLPNVIPEIFEPKLQSTDVKSAIETALVQVGAISEKQQIISDALASAGLGLQECAYNIAFLAQNSREATRLRATERAIQLHGIPLAPTNEVDSKPSFVFNIQSENTNLNTLFAPER